MSFDLESVKKELYNSRDNSSERDLLKLLKNNSFLFSELYTRHFVIQPVFSEISFGDTVRCDFCWLNDNSDGPEWVLVEIEKPNIRLFTQKNEPSSELNHGIEQIKSWQRYFSKNPLEANRIFGAVNKFRYILVIGENDDWNDIDASSWRSYENKNYNIEIRSMNVFDRAIELYEKIPDHFSSFRDNPVALNSKDLRDYLKQSDYINFWKKR